MKCKFCKKEMKIVGCVNILIIGSAIKYYCETCNTIFEKNCEYYPYDISKITKKDVVEFNKENAK